MLDYDISFNYKYIVRYNVFLNDINYVNSYKMPFLSKTCVSVSFKKLGSIDPNTLMSYYYLFRYFYGNKSFVTKYSTFFSLRKTYYSYTIVSEFKYKKVFIPIYYYFFDIKPIVRIRKWFFFSEKGFSWMLWNVNLFADKKTNLGLFYLSEPLNYRLFLSNGDAFSSKIIFNGLKLYY